MGAHHGTLRRLVHLFKYEGRPGLARPLGELMRLRGAAVLSDADLVVPVPLHRRRRRTRGFNQADALARQLDRPQRQSLRRTSATPPQAGRSRRDRRRNVRGVFALRSRREQEPLQGARVVLVDDVLTTGATLEACARVLRAAGAAEVRALTLTKVVRSRRP